MAVTVALTFGSFGDIVLIIQLIIILSVCAHRLWRWRDDYYRLFRETERAQSALDSLCFGQVSKEVPGSRIVTDAKQHFESVIRTSKELTDAYEPQIVQKADKEELCEGVREIDLQHNAVVARAFKKYSRECLLMLKWKAGRNNAKAKEIVNEISVNRYHSQMMVYFHSLVPLLMRTPGLTKGNSIKLIDAFGSTRLVPIEFCFTFESFQSYLEGHFTGRFGEQYVKRKDYTLSAEGSEVDKINWQDYIRCGVEITMGIIIRKAFVSDPESRVAKEARCPRCSTITGIPMTSGKKRIPIECRKCEGLFEISRTKGSFGNFAYIPFEGYECSHQECCTYDPESKREEDIVYFRWIKVLFTQRPYYDSSRPITTPIQVVVDGVYDIAYRRIDVSTKFICERCRCKGLMCILSVTCGKPLCEKCETAGLQSCSDFSEFDQ